MVRFYILNYNHGYKTSAVNILSLYSTVYLSYWLVLLVLILNVVILLAISTINNLWGKKTTINFQKLRLVNKQLETSIQVQTKAFTQRIRIEGFADPRNKTADIRFFNIDTGAIKVPYLIY